MKIYKYTISKDDTYQYFVENAIVELLGETYLDENFHRTKDNVFYLSGTDDIHQKMKEILFDPQLVLLCHDRPAVILDVTDKVYEYILVYTSFQNLDNESNIFLNLYKTQSKDDILDKILDRGVDSLNVYDKQILNT